MRDPARIDRILKLLEFYWRKHPDLRLAQIVLNACTATKDRDRAACYNFEDSEFESILRADIDAVYGDK